MSQRLHAVRRQRHRQLRRRHAVPVGSAAGLVPYQAVLSRDSSATSTGGRGRRTSRTRTASGGSASTAACGRTGRRRCCSAAAWTANVVRPDLLPQQCQDAADPQSAVQQLLAARVGDLRRVRQRQDGHPRERVVLLRLAASALAGNLNNLSGVTLTWGLEPDSGACSTTANASVLERRERRRLHPGERADRHAVGQHDPLRPGHRHPDQRRAGRRSEDLQIGRTREIDRRASITTSARQIHVGVEFIYRNYDRGIRARYTHRLPAGRARASRQLGVYTDRQIYIDPITRPVGAVLHGLPGLHAADGHDDHGHGRELPDLQGRDRLRVEKRASQRWQAMGSFTYNFNRNFTPLGRLRRTRPGVEFSNGALSGLRFVGKANGSYSLPWGMRSGANLQIQDGSVRNSQHQRSRPGLRRHVAARPHATTTADVRRRRAASPAGREPARRER